MRSTWLSTASAVFVCAAALANAAKLPAPLEQIHYDQAGNLVWNDDTQVTKALPSLGRPDFSGLNFDHVAAAAIPAKQAVEEVLSETMKQAEDVLSWTENEIERIEHKIEQAITRTKHGVKQWIHTGKVFVDGLEFERLTHPSFPNYSLRLNTQQSESFCDKDVVQYSGYLDISDSKHLWFIFFESRNNPKHDPVVLWLNGGPGCSSSTGLLFELGPCRVIDEGRAVKNNPHSWNNKANLLFLDQPVDVGYSYSDNDQVNNSPAAAEDVYAFLQLFFTKFPKYSKLPFTASGESYAGTYLPNIASTIYKKNQNLALARYSNPELAPKHINLETVMIGNGLSSPQYQFPSVPEYACGADNKYALFDPESSTCATLEQQAATCKSLIESCQKYNSRLTCTPAALYCWSRLYGPAQETGKNLYDVRKDCDREKDGPLCYKDMEYIETLLNNPNIKKNLGVPESVTFQSCNMNINQAFLLQGDSMHDSAALLPELIEDGIRVLIYAGEADFMCNYMGNLEWMQQLQTSYLNDFNNGTAKEWTVNGKKAGQIRQGGKGAGNLTYARVYEAGHMVPYDQPEVAAEMLNRWLANKALA
ncbi:related to carboxypeptidase [Melanopsichium pennsylvanicum]|uniref:carboxypeptidase C n=2 Tax=Melanopsichium pennsylvanicum TaxID=63383 RepID=A0AAJ4XIG2_9BASI|nr:related to carboxypeptidase [Melanopsichium pennsylvanicum 4]SNX82969.1 related to carboxypeptidase [Melanopsichium pennsylvanicum]